MDVRCDRCQTEYELDDASVGEAGASVQCTTCGHTFVVSRIPVSERPTPTVTAAAAAAAAGMAPSTSWMLTTEEGKTHRFRDPTTLQKWIVERRVGRADRVCPPGGSWRRLGDVDELRPFFDVVDQADRASAAARGARPTSPETPSRKTPRRNYSSPDEDDDDVLQGRGGQRPGRFDSDMSGLAAMGVDDSLDVILPKRHTGRNVVLGVLFLGLAGFAAYLGFKDPHGLGRGAAPAPVASAPAAPTPGAPTAAPPTPPPAPAGAPTAAAPSPGAPTVAPPAPSPAPPAAASSAHAPAPGAATPPPSARPAEEPTPSAAQEPKAPRARSYEQLVADGDRALENGSTGRAQKLYDEALKLQPNGVAAMTGTAYVLLDKQKPLAAIDMFKRALSSSPGFPQALFGLGEAYRAQGSPAQAVEAYKHYLESSPGGADAPAARRQLRELESLAASRRQQSGEPAPAPTEPTAP